MVWKQPEARRVSPRVAVRAVEEGIFKQDLLGARGREGLVLRTASPGEALDPIPGGGLAATGAEE